MVEGRRRRQDDREQQHDRSSGRPARAPAPPRARRVAGVSGARGEPAYRRIDAPATPEEKTALARLSPQQIRASELAGERITNILASAPRNPARTGGLKAVAE